MAEIVFAARPDVEAVAYIADKTVGGRFSFDWRDVREAEHLTAFVAAKAMTADILADLHEGVKRGVDEGWSRERFVREMKPLLEAKGWWGRQRMVDPETGVEREVTVGTPRRLRTIYGTNLRMAQAAGDWARFERNRALRPLLRYRHTPQDNPRLEHRAWDGITLPIEHPFWVTHFTPNGWGCKCWISSHRAGAEITSEDELERKGAWRKRAWRNGRTGAVEEVPVGIDPGFAYNVGQARTAAFVPPPESQEPPHRSAIGDRLPRTLPPLRPRLPPDDVAVRPDLDGVNDVDKVFEAFSAVLGKGEGEVFIDRAQLPVVIGRRMFERRDSTGAVVGPKTDLPFRAPLAELFAATLRDPDEIWHALQSEVSTGGTRLVRYYVAAFDAGEAGRQFFAVAYHHRAVRWEGMTAFAPGDVNDPDSQAQLTDRGHRWGTLVYRRK
jgi:hypothetical protein